MPSDHVETKASGATKTARAKGKVPPAQGRSGPDAPPRVKKEPMSELRTLGGELNAERTPVEERSAEQEELARKTLDTLRNEFERVLAIKEKLGAESKIGAKEKGRETKRSDEKVRALIASLEGMSRF